MPTKRASSKKVEDPAAIEAKAEAPPGSPLGRIAFAPSRRGMPFEANTDMEDRVERSLRYYILNNTDPVPEVVDLIRDLVRQGLYSGVFRKPRKAMLYRGLTLPEKALRGMLGSAVGRRESLPSRGELEVDVVVRPPGSKSKLNAWTPGKTVTSWSESLSVAREFSTGRVATAWGKGQRDYGVVLWASRGDNPDAFLDMRSLYGLDSYTRDFADEAEVLALGPVRCRRVEWIKLSDIDDLDDDY